MKRHKPSRAGSFVLGKTQRLRLTKALEHGRRRQKKLLGECLRKISRRSIHDLRIATRRQLALVTVAGLAGGVRPTGLCRSLKHCLHDTNKLRDADVQLALVDELLRDHPELTSLRKHLGKTVKRRIRITGGKLKRRERKLAKHQREQFAAIATIPQTPTAALEIRAALGEAIAEARESGRGAKQGGEPLHRARLALKRLRDTTEALQGVVPGITAAWIGELHRHQRALGEIRDLELFVRRLKRFSARQPRGQRRFRRVRREMAARLARRLHAYRPGLPAPPFPLRVSSRTTSRPTP